MRPALLVIGVKTPCPTAVNDLIALFSESGLPVFHVLTGDEAEPPEPCGPGDVIIPAPDGLFVNTGLEAILWEQDVNTLVLCGFPADDFIPRAAAECFERNFAPILAGDAMTEIDSTALAELAHGYAIEPVSNGRIREIVAG